MWDIDFLIWVWNLILKSLSSIGNGLFRKCEGFVNMYGFCLILGKFMFNLLEVGSLEEMYDY